MPINLPIAKAFYFWIHGTNSSTGNGVVVGPFTSEAQAREDAANLGDVKVFKLPTRDQSRATRIIKAKMLKTNGVRRALQRVNHGLRGESQEIPEEGDEDDAF